MAPRIQARLNIVKLLVPPVILRPTLQESDNSKYSNAQPMSREATIFQRLRDISLVLEQFAVYLMHLL